MSRRTPRDQSKRLSAGQVPIPGQATGLSNRPEHMSHSAVSDWHKCGAGYVWKKDSPGYEPGNVDTIRGTLAHGALELAYSAGVPTCAEHVTRHFDDAFELFRQDGDDWEVYDALPTHLQTQTVDEAHTCLNRLWEFDEHPIGFDIDIVGTEIEVETVMNGVPFITYIDLAYRTAAGYLVLVDWKTGKEPVDFFKGTVKNQLWMSAAAWYNKTYGTEDQEFPGFITAVWLGDPPGVLTIPVNPHHLKTAVAYMREAWDGIAANKFGTNPGALCSWCPAAELCTDGQKAILERSLNPKKTMGPYTQAALIRAETADLS